MESLRSHRCGQNCAVQLNDCWGELGFQSPFLWFVRGQLNGLTPRSGPLGLYARKLDHRTSQQWRSGGKGRKVCWADLQVAVSFCSTLIRKAR